ncbi:MAG TPA: DUF2336 domain-containing protein [Xanthobacteraceae bacterium]|nr:DUF2336 domain-containing protein [Xanthobacteraceae bacterium]
MPESSGFRSLIDELEANLASGNVQHRLKILQRVTDLFLAGSHHYSGAEIELFDDVLMRLVTEIETEARARLSQRLASVVNAPPGLIRRLAFDDAIVVAAPVLASSPQLSDADLIENAATKSQDHLYAIAQRLKLSEAVTDVLVERGNRRVVRRVASNDGAQFSFKTYEKLVSHARDDRKLGLTIGRRSDIPRQCFLRLLETASAEVREKLEAANPEAAREIRETVAEVAGAMQREVRDASRRHAVAARDAKHLFRSHRLSEMNVHAAACAQQFAKTAAALSMLGPFPIDLVERVLIDKGSETVLILAKAAGCSWTTTKAILIMQAAGRGLSQQDLDGACLRFERLNRETAQRVVKFYERRSKLAADKASGTPVGPEDAELQPAV